MNCAQDEDDPEIRTSSATSEAMSLAEAASFMRIGVDALRALIFEGLVPALSLNQKHWVLLRSDLIDFVRATARQQQLHRKSLAEEPETLNLNELPLRRGRPRKNLDGLFD